MIELPSDLPADLVPLAWLIGVWEGSGIIDYHVGDDHIFGEFTHRVSFSHDGGDYLNYSATAAMLGENAAPLVSEVGFWRLAKPMTDSDAGPGLLPASAAPAIRTVHDVEALRQPTEGFEIEVNLVHSDGVSELYLGQINGPRIDIATDAIVRTASSRAYSAATRMYGLVDSHLLWAWDIAALGSPLASHASARLAKVS